MYELNRILLRNFGPRDARYENVDLDFSAVGAPVQAASLVPVAGHVTQRPSPASLVMLQNGGGKGVLLTGITCTTIPRRHQDLEVLRNFVVSLAQPSHIVLEWADARTGRLLVTAQVLAPEGDGIKRRFYSFHPSAALSADDLPFHRDGHWLPFDHYCTELRELQSTVEALELQILEVQEKWEKHQDSLGLEPGLFDVQRKMNATESGAAEAFTTSSAGAFVQWLLEKANDDDKYAKLGDAFATYASAHDQREKLGKERQFALAMEQICSQVADRHQEHTDQQRETAQAKSGLVTLASGLMRRHQILIAAAQTTTGTVNTAYRDHEAAKQDLDVANVRVAHVRWASCGIELREAAAEQKRVAGETQELQDSLAGWRSVPVALRHAAAQDHHSRMQQALSQAERAAAPYVQARDTAAAALRARYAAAESQARTEADDVNKKIVETRGSIQQWRERSNSLHTHAGTAEGEQRLLRRQVQDFEQQLHTAREQEQVKTDESAADASARMDAEADHHGRLLEEAEQEQDLARTRRTQAYQRLPDVQQQALDDRRAAEEAEAAITRLRDRAETVRRHALTAELLELSPEHLQDGDALAWLADHCTALQNLAERRSTALDRTLRRTQHEHSADEELLAALDISDGLLPATKEVRSLCAELTAHGTDAVPGWQWLRDNVPADDHHSVITAHPDLVGGIIVSGGPPALEAAQRHLERTRPLPAAAIAVGTGERMLTPAPDVSGRMVPEPTPALHDEQAAAVERARVEARLAASAQALAELEERLALTRDLDNKIANWLHETGSVPVPVRLEQLQELQEAAEAAQVSLDAARNGAEQLDDAVAAAEGACKEQDSAHRKATGTAQDLHRLAEAENKAGHARDRIAVLEEEAQQRRRELEALDEKEEAAHDDITRMTRAVEAATQLARSHAQARKKITATPEAEQAQQAEGTPPEALAALQYRYEQALDDLRSVDIGEDQRQRATDAENTLRACQEEWAQVPDRIKPLAKKHSRTPAAADEVHRDAVERGLTQQINSLQEQLQRLRDKESRLKERHHTLTGPAGNLSPQDTERWTPHTLEEARDLTARAEDAQAQAKEAERRTNEQYNAARRQQSQHTRELDAFGNVLARLGTTIEHLGVHTAPDAYQGTADAAEPAVQQAMARYEGAQRKLTDTERRVEASVSNLKDQIADVTFEQLDIPLRTQMSALDRRYIPEAAREWTTALRRAAAALTTQLEGMTKAREALASQLSGYVTELLQQVDQASRFSVFPDGPTPWAGQRFLTIRYKKPDPAMLAAQMRETIDTLTANPRTRKLKGTEVVMRCLHAAVPRFTAEVMKPNATQRVDRVPVEKMGKIFSGGQELTGAILLYCALAALRTSPGPRSRTRHGGLLLLDNPIGRANAPYLVDIQTQMAAALGIQLIYTTGLSDETVTARFPATIQLRNDAEARTGLARIRLDDQTRNALIPGPRTAPDTHAPEPTGYLSSARLYAKGETDR
ncbi:hypothetical protein [Streptomyces scabiei]|uniref:hypothetical protein n=1 Tax=Streptomyces scabiei TaxID=1930 RepID=UPI002FEF18BC